MQRNENEMERWSRQMLELHEEQFPNAYERKIAAGCFVAAIILCLVLLFVL